MMENKVLGLLSLAARAGKLTFGSEAGRAAVCGGKAFMVFVTRDAGERTKKLMRDKCGFYKIPVYEMGEKESLGKRLGKGSVSVVSVCDRSFAKALETHRDCDWELL